MSIQLIIIVILFLDNPEARNVLKERNTSAVCNPVELLLENARKLPCRGFLKQVSVPADALIISSYRHVSPLNLTVTRHKLSLGLPTDLPPPLRLPPPDGYDYSNAPECG
ncbi:10767_t:CDS:2 [Paraglomus occultum]|uniref:10767_t:CDS:1 n=1 Tax=Paraglomus occultum TaxID=144539 RepID=A0A9N9F491_9GLOM|nr:10767_t:CDS:2 [Paraglomus occultum]